MSAVPQGQGSRVPEGQGPGARGQGFRELIAWQKAHQLALGIFRTTQPLSRDQNWLVTQLTRAAVSVPANIAEGYSRESTRDYLRYLQIARGSLAETEYFLLFIRDAGLLPASVVDDLDTKRTDVGRLLVGLIRSLQRKVASQQPTSRIGDERAAYQVNGPDDLGPWPSTVDPAEEDEADGLGPWPLTLGPAEHNS